MVEKKYSKIVKGVISFIKIISFILLSLISMLLSVNMFKELGVDNLSKVLLICTAGSLEGTKIVIYIIAKSHKVQKKKGYIQKYAFYGILLALSIVASFGFILTTIQYTSNTITRSSNDDTITMYQSQLKMFDSQIQSYLKQMDELPVDYITARAKIASSLEDIQNKMVETQIKINELNLQESEKMKVSTSMFSLIGEVLNLSEKVVMFIILFVVSLCIELGIIATSPDLIQLQEIVPNEKETEEKPKRKYSRSFKKEIEKMPSSLKEDEVEKVFNNEHPTMEVKNSIEKKESEIVKTKEKEPSSALEAIANKVNEPLVSEYKIPEGLHPMSKDIPIRNSSLLYDKYIKFINALFNIDSPYLKEKDIASIDAGLSILEGTTIFNNIATKRGNNGNFLIEFRKNQNKWVANYSKEEILKIYETLLAGGK